MVNMFLEFLLSLRWLWIIVIFLAYKLINKYIEIKSYASSIQRNAVIRDTKYSEEEIIGHLDYIIKEALDEYVLFYITPKNIYYINTKMENEIITALAQKIPERLSPTLMHHLGYIYDDYYLGDFIGGRIYMVIMNYVIEFNINNHQAYNEQQKNK